MEKLLNERKKTLIDINENMICLIRILEKSKLISADKVNKVNQEIKLKTKNKKKIDMFVPSGPSKVIFLFLIQLFLQI